MLPNKVRVIVGPEHMYVSRYNIKSDAVALDNKHFTRADATDTYYAQVHAKAIAHIQFLLRVRKAVWEHIDEQAAEILAWAAEHNHVTHFDAPKWIICIKPWKHAKHGEWFFVGEKLRNRLKQKVKNYA